MRFKILTDLPSKLPDLQTEVPDPKTKLSDLGFGWIRLNLTADSL